MTTIHNDTDEEAVRQELAQADEDTTPLPDGMVWRNSDSRRYHTREDCKRINDNKQMVRKEIAETWDTWQECRICSGKWRETHEGSGNGCEECGNASARNVPRLGRYLCEDCHPRPRSQSRDDTARPDK
jgi:hypothetical protein